LIFWRLYSNRLPNAPGALPTTTTTTPRPTLEGETTTTTPCPPWSWNCGIFQQMKDHHLILKENNNNSISIDSNNRTMKETLEMKIKLENNMLDALLSVVCPQPLLDSSKRANINALPSYVNKGERI